jgi:hypothetical protein
LMPPAELHDAPMGLAEPLRLHRQRIQCGRTPYPQGAAASPPRRPVEPGAPPP